MTKLFENGPKAQFAVAPQLTLAAIFVNLHLFFFGGIMPLNGKRGDNMATSSITANFRIDDPKAARDFVDAFIRHSRKASTPPSPNFRFVTTVEEMEALKAQRL